MSTARADVYTYDAGGELFDWTTWGPVTFSGPQRRIASPAYLSVGDSKFEGRLIVLVDQISVGNGDERYDVILQGSETADFASVEVLALMAFGASAVRPGGAVTSGPGKFEVGASNVQRNTLYPYMRIYTDVFGTSPSIGFRAFLALNQVIAA